jgi:hypothetical protein
MTGIVHGGWGYVWAAYSITALVLGGYAVRAFVLHRIGKRLADYEKP